MENEGDIPSVETGITQLNIADGSSFESYSIFGYMSRKIAEKEGKRLLHRGLTGS